MTDVDSDAPSIKFQIALSIYLDIKILQRYLDIQPPVFLVLMPGSSFLLIHPAVSPMALKIPRFDRFPAFGILIERRLYFIGPV